MAVNVGGSGMYVVPNKIPIGAEDIAVEGVAIGPSAAQVTDEVNMAIFQIVGGTAAETMWGIVGTATAGGAGEHEFDVDNRERWVVYGHDNIKNFTMIETTNTVTVAVQYFGTR